MKTFIVVLLLVTLTSVGVVEAGEPQAANNITLYVEGMVWGGSCVAIGGEEFCLDRYDCRCSEDLVEGVRETVAFRVSIVKIDGKTYFRIIDGSIVPRFR